MKRLELACTVGLALAGSFQVMAQGPSAATEPLTLSDTLRRTVQVGTVAAGRARADGVTDAAQRVPRWLNPSLELRGENWASGIDLPHDVFVVATQPLELFGTRGARLNLARADANESRAAAHGAERQAILEVTRGYLDVVVAQEAAAIFEQQRAGLAEIVAALRLRVAEGVASEADLRKFDTELATIDIQALRLSVTTSQTLSVLAARLQLPEMTARRLVLPGPIPLPAATDADIETALDRRADVQLAKARHERALQALALARARSLPDVQVVGGLKRTSGVNTGVAAVLLPIPLADRQQVEIARQSGEARATALELDATRAIARAEIRSALIAATTLRDRSATTTAQLIEPATIVRDAARAAFREGSFDPLRLVDAERAWTEARRTQAALAATATLAAIEARLALGLEALP